MGFFNKERKIVTDKQAIDELLTRGVENVIPRELAQKKLTSGEPMRIYLGIDPTGAKLHLGHSVPLRKLKAFSDLGHHVIFLVGSFTAMIGDPTGRDAMREALTREKVEANFKDYKRQAQKILDFSKVEIRYNHEWLEKLKFDDIVRLASKFTVQQMLQRDMFQKRLEEQKPIALHEFLYPLMVGYDSVVLDVDCELGGSDQEFNILAGRHLQQAFGKRDKFVLTTRLIEGTDGRKMSKTYDNAVYFDDAPSDMYGKLMSIKDELVATYFETLTDVPTDEVQKILEGHPKEAKMRLAREIVTKYHSKDAAEKSEQDWTNTFSQGGVPADVPTVAAGKLRDIVDGLSTSELRRLVDAGAVSYVETGEKITSIDAEVSGVIRIGKHRFLKAQ
ncbi:MAG: tyrosyl-tRNA synthetase [Candidatus Adlerbacteria bacterium]|nr:tyrosyl-tRNA synthetase [Candidatus Adlerbacteria bacterium]